MEELAQDVDLIEQGLSIWQQAAEFGLSLLQPWRFYQILILLAVFLAAHFLARVIEPRLRRWMRGLEGMRASQLRFLITIAKRTRSIIFILFGWAVYLGMQAATWPSRSYLIGLVMTLVTALVFVAIASRLIRHPLLRSVVTWCAWIYATMEILGVQETVTGVLDSIGLSLGGSRITLLLVIQAVLTIGVLLMLARWASKTVEQRLVSNEHISPSLEVLIEKIASVVFYAIAFVIGLQVLGFDLSTLTLFSGAIGLGIGFGLQKVVSNLISGLIVLLDKSIKPGDVISLGDTFGWVTELNARYVGVNTRDGREYLIPNEDLITSQVVNWSHSSDLIRLDIYFGVSYHSDPHEVRKLAREAASSVPRVVSTPAAVCHIVGFGDSSIDFILRFWIRDPSGGLTNVRGAVYLALWDTLKENDIEIPFPRRDITIVGDAPGTD